MVAFFLDVKTQLQSTYYNDFGRYQMNGSSSLYIK